jgi:hypothetical protein
MKVISVTDLFRKICGQQDHQTWHHLIFFLWVLLKGRVYSNKQRTIDAIRRYIAAITDVTLPVVFANLQTRIQKYLDVERGHFQHML